MAETPDFIRYRHIRNCHQCDPAYGAGVADALAAYADVPGLLQPPAEE